MTIREQETNAKAFAEFWKNKGYEKGQSQQFWISLLSNIFGIKDTEKFIEFEDQVHIDKNTGFIDAYIPSTKVLIEQKSIDKDLKKGIRQSDGSLLKPFQQAKRYIAELPVSMHPKYVITCNFKSFLIYNMENPNGDPEEILLENLEKEFYRLQFLVDVGNEHLKREMEISIQAGDLVGKLYDEILKLYINPESEETLKSLNMLCVRLVFCLYAEDSGIFGKRNMFYDYLSKFEIKDLRRALIDLFRVLDTKPEDRDPYMMEDLGQFPYVNGGLFSNENIEIPNLNEKVKELLLSKASENFDWSDISPTIFGAVFESTLNPETRRSGGMHYTSIENIHKVIDPLFLNELKEELNEIKSVSVLKTRNKKLEEFQDKTSKLKFLDPACGSGNFLTETYLSLRKIENEVIETLTGGQIGFGDRILSPIKVSISQFFGIEINDFAVTVATTALWIAESQMMKETEKIVRMNLEFLPLKTYANIVEANALRIDWNDVIPKEKANYIMGNPPFLGYSMQDNDQKKDMLNIYVDENGKTYKSSGKIDYVAAWYFKASQYIYNTEIFAAFVSTNSITQGEQVSYVWEPLYERFNININFAWRTFKWNSETKEKAAVHCVIIGFSHCDNKKEKIIFSNDKIINKVKNISPYLIDSPTIFIDSRSKPLCNVIEMTTGNRPADGGNLIIEAEEYEDFIKKEPNAQKYIKKLTGAAEFINNKPRYCLWLVNANLAEIRKMPEVMKRIEECKLDRLNGADDRRKLADTPMLFRETLNPKTFIVVPATSSENRRYIPIGFLDETVIPTNALIILPNADLYYLGVLISNVHMAWMRAVCGRLEMRYRYSKDIVYNNFPWPTPTEEQKEKIEKAAQDILNARNLYPNSSLADLYDELIMPKELRKAHQANDKAVMEAYGFDWKNMGESDCVAELMKMYQKLTQK